MDRLPTSLALAVAALVGLAIAGGASAAATSQLVVDQGSIGGKCSDSYSLAQVSASTPWCTIAHAFAVVPANRTVYVRSGTYSEQVLSGAYGKAPRLTGYVTFQPYGYGSSHPEKVTIDGLSLANTAYLRFQGLDLVGSDANAAQFTPAVTVGGNTAHVEVLDNVIADQGIDLESDPDDVLIQDNYIHALTLNCAVNTQLDGSGIVGGGNDVTVLGNVIADAQDAAMSFGSASNLIVAENTVSSALQSAGSCGHHVDLIELDNHAIGPVGIWNNLFAGGSQFILRNTTGLSFENNLVLDVDGWMSLTADPDARIISNTWWGGNQVNTGAGSLILGGYAPGSGWTKPPFDYTNTMAGTVVENNIMRLFGVDKYVSSSQYRESYNLIYGRRANNSGLGDPGTHDLFATPVFVDPGAENFHLALGSPGVGAGDPSTAPAVDMLGRERSAAPDIGALQDGSHTTTAAPHKAKRRRLRLISSRVHAGPRDRWVSITVGCSESCAITATGSASLHPPARAAAATALLPRRTLVSLRAGRRTILKLRIPARLLGRDRVLAVTIKLKARASGGSSASGRRTLRVRA